MNVPDPGLEGRELDAEVALRIMGWGVNDAYFETGDMAEIGWPGAQYSCLRSEWCPSSNLILAHDVARKAVEKTDHATFMSAIAYVIYCPEMTFPDFLIVREAQRDIPYVDSVFAEWGIFNADPTTICRAALLPAAEGVVRAAKSIPNTGNLDCSDSLRELVTNEENEEKGASKGEGE